MEHFVLVPASVYRESLSVQTVTQQRLPRHQAEQNPTYQIGSLKKDCQRRLFSRKNFDLVSSSQTRTILYWKVLCWSYTVRFCLTTASWNRRRSRHLLYLPVLVSLSLSGCEAKWQGQREEAGSLWKYERQKLQRWYTQGAAV